MTRSILFNLQHSGTHDAYMNLIRGDAELILVARQPSEDEISAAKLRGVILDYRPVALDAFVFLVNVENPVESLDVNEVRKIYTGKITSWDQIGVDLGLNGNRAITAYRRDQNSGSQELMETLVMQGEKMIDLPDLLLYGDDGAVQCDRRGRARDWLFGLLLCLIHAAHRDRPHGRRRGGVPT